MSFGLVYLLEETEIENNKFVNHLSNSPSMERVRVAYVLHHSIHWSYICYRASSACTEQENLTAVQAVRAAAAVGTIAGAVAAEVSAPVW